MTLDAGVDGGQSQVRVRIAGQGEIVTSAGVAHLEGDTVQLLVDAVSSAWSRVNPDGAELGRLVLGITTMPTDAAIRQRLAAGLAAATGAREVWLTGDAVTAHAGALPGHNGIVLVVGTGIACLAVDAARGRTRRVDGDGFLIGDGGASFWIGRRGISAALEATDGRGGETTLLAAATERFGEPDAIASHVHSLDRPVDAVAQFAAVVQEHARAGDGIAASIVSAAAGELVATIVAAARIFGTEPVPLAVTGRAAAHGTPLREALVSALPAAAPGVMLVEAAATPLDGACEFAAGGAVGTYHHLISQWRRE